MDDVDRAQALNEQFQEAALAGHQQSKPPRESRVTCLDCDEPIPEARRRASPECTRCIDCQTLLEHWRPL